MTMRPTMLLERELVGKADMVPDEEILAGLASLKREWMSAVQHLAAGSCPGRDATCSLPAPRAAAPVARPAGLLARSWSAIVRLCSKLALAVATTTSKVVYGVRDGGADICQLGPYTLLEKLGEGGMGVVYLARHAMLDRPTAVKFLPPDRLAADSQARFEREVQLTARLTHPNTIRVFDYGQTADGIAYYAMEYLEGTNLADLVAAQGPLPAGRVIDVLEQVAGALAEAHEVGLVHCDVKPSNIFLTEQGGISGVAKLFDFGLVREVGARAQSNGAASGRDARIAGTPLFMAPEAIASPDEVDARSDLYALGAVGYFLLTGQHVFSGRSLLEVCGHQLHSVPVAPSRRIGAPIAAELERLILACLSKDPAQRPADARTLQSSLRACRDARSAE